MISKMAMEDLKRLRDGGIVPSDEDVVALNDLGLRIERKKSGTVANAPRVALAGNIALHEPTIAALEWWHDFGRDAAWTAKGKLYTHYFMLANARREDLFAALTSHARIRQAVSAWKREVYATESELWRAMLWVKEGSDIPESEDSEQPKKSEVSPIEDDEAFDKIAHLVISAAAVTGIRPEDLKTQTVSQLFEMMIVASKTGNAPIKTSVARDYIAYQQTLKRIESNGLGQ